MTLKSIFQKPVDRPIEGVIKADDEASLRLELEEYVLTQEVEKRLESFLSAYNHYEVANGVWVSGFFGSGKSHLLKVLALLLENRTIDGMPALDLFLPKCKDNEILRADLKKEKHPVQHRPEGRPDQQRPRSTPCCRCSSKVFDEMCGYYGKQGYIAHFERELDEPTGCSMRSRRPLPPWSLKAGSGRGCGSAQDQIDQGLCSRSPARPSQGILDRYQADYRVSIEDFAERSSLYRKRRDRVSG
jgi:hypothetical protein